MAENQFVGCFMAVGVYGSARFFKPKGKAFDEASKGNRLFLGGMVDNPEEYLSLPINKHFLTIGGTREGKGVSLIIPNLLSYQGSVLVIDPKGENAFLTAQRRRDMGQKVYILDPWGEVNRRYGEQAGVVEEVATFNPLSILEPSNDDYTDDIAYIADALILSQSKDPFFDDSARALVAGLIAYAIEVYDGASLPYVRKWLSKSAEDIAKIAIEAQSLNDESLGYESLAAKKLARFTKATDTVASIIQTAQTQTENLDSTAIQKSLLKSSFSFSDLTAQPTTIYLVLPVDKLQTHGRWLRLMISIGIRTIARNTKKMPLPVLFILDEFGTIGKLSAVAQAFGLMAGLQMCVWAFVQDLVQLKRDYPDDWETFISNSAAITCFRVMDNTTTNYISAMLGQTTVEQVSEASAYVREKTINIGFATDQDRPNARPLMTPDEVRRLNKTWGLFITNDGPSFFEKVRYFKNPVFSAQARQDPNYTGVIEEKEEEPQPPPLSIVSQTSSPQWTPPPPSASAPIPQRATISTEWPTKTKTEIQLAAFQQQVLIPIEGLAQTPKHPWAWFLMFLPFEHSGESEVAENARIDEANKYIKIYKNLELEAINQNEKMRAYGIEDVDGFGFYDVNKTAHGANVRSIRATLERNAEKITQYEKENGLEVVEAQAKKVEEFL